MTQVRDKMTTDPVVCDATVTLAQAARRMRDEGIGSVLVSDRGSFSILTDRDIVVRAVAEGVAPDRASVGDIATHDVEMVAPNDEIDEVVRRMARRNVRRIAVVDEDRPVGIVSLGDLAILRDPGSVLADISAADSNNN